MVGRGRNEPHAGSRMAHFCNPWINLAAGKLPALAWLRALGHFDLQLARVDQVITGHAKPR